MGKASGSVTAFSRADGFVVIPAQQEYAEAGEAVEVALLGRGLEPADLVVIGSHCVGLDWLLGRLHAAGVSDPEPRSAQRASDARGRCRVGGEGRSNHLRNVAGEPGPLQAPLNDSGFIPNLYRQ